LTTIKELVLRQLSVDPDISLKACKKVVPGLTKSNFYKIKKEWKIGLLQSTPSVPIKGHDGVQKNIPPRVTAATPTPLSTSPESMRTIIKKFCLEQLRGHKKFAGVALQTLTKDAFLREGEIIDDIYWTSDEPAYERPDWLYPWQPAGIDMMRAGHCMYLGSRQKVGKTLTAALADFEDMIANPGFVVTLIAPRRDLAQKLLHQMFKETIELKRCEYIDGVMNIIPTGIKFNLWNIFKHYIVIDNKLEKVFKNGSKIQVITLDYASVQGISSDVVHIEEFDKVVRLTKEGGRSDKLEALAGLLPQIRARPTAKIRITCNNASGLFRILRDRLDPFGRFFPVYMETPHPGRPFDGQHHIANDFIPDEKPEVDDILKVLMTALMGQGYVKQQLENVDDFTGELWSPRKVEEAYNRGKSVDQDRRFYPRVYMGIDPGAGHGYAVVIFTKLGNQVILLWAQVYHSGDPYDGYDSKLDQMGSEIAEALIYWSCHAIAAESNSGNKLIIPFIESYYKKKIIGDNIHRSKWHVIWSNFGREHPEGSDISKVVPKNRFIITMSLLFDHDYMVLQERNNTEELLHLEIVMYDPSKTAEKYKGDICEAMLHCCYHLVGGKAFLKEVTGQKKPDRVFGW
jgi:hypothetical protein